MNYKLLALDLDGTLLQPDLSILPDLVDKLRRLQSRGVTVTLATGRAFPSALKYAKEIGIDCPVICYNGSVVKTLSGTALKESFVNENLVKAIIAECEKRGWYLQLYNNDKIVVDRVVNHTTADPDYANMPCLELGPLSKADIGPTPKMMTRCDPSETAFRTEILNGVAGGSLYIAGSTPRLVEMMEKGTCKSDSLLFLCDKLNIDISQAVVCGDGGNDLDMISIAGAGCAMANAVERVKHAADFVASAPNGHGVLQAIDKYFSEI